LQPSTVTSFTVVSPTLQPTNDTCGAVVFTRADGPFRFVIIQSKAGIYGIPKGHMEGNETEKETAVREIWEETGLTVEITENFRAEDSYLILKNGEQRLKQVVYFLAEYENQTSVAQEAEVNAIHLMDYETALGVFQFESAKRILREAHQYITK
jgi:8-oxo-dGTP pyrophosphatase MutT (NUDIX family)